MGLFKEFLEEEADIIDMLEDEESFDVICEYIVQEYIDEDNNVQDSEELTEVLSRLARIKQSMRMKRNAKKLKTARDKKAKKSVTKEEVMSKTRKSVINKFKTKLAKGKTDLSPQEKEKIEKKISSKGIQSKIDKLTKRQFKAKRDEIKIKKANARRPASPEKDIDGINEE